MVYFSRSINMNRDFSMKHLIQSTYINRHWLAARVSISWFIVLNDRDNEWFQECVVFLFLLMKEKSNLLLPIDGTKQTYKTVKRIYPFKWFNHQNFEANSRMDNILFLIDFQNWIPMHTEHSHFSFFEFSTNLKIPNLIGFECLEVKYTVC